MLDFDWEVGLFRMVTGLWRKLQRRPEEPQNVQHLADHQRRLGLLAQLVSGLPVQVLPSEGRGGVRGDHILMPQTIAVFPSAERGARCYLLRALLGGVVIRDRLDEGLPADANARLALELQRWQRAEALLIEELPQVEALLEAAHADELALRGEERSPLEMAIRAALAGEQAAAEQHVVVPADWDAMPWLWGRMLTSERQVAAGSGDGGQPDVITGTELEARPVDSVSVIELDEREAERSVLHHPFEQVETVDSWHGGARDTDGSDELEDHADALADCDLREVIRGGEPPGSLYRCDLLLDVAVGDAGEEAVSGIPYDEWDQRRRCYRKEWCTVVPRVWERRDAAWFRSAQRRLAPVVGSALTRIRASREQLHAQPRQLDGDDLDLEAVVRERADVVAGHGGEQRLYRRIARRRQDWASCVLIDVSLSADAGVGGQRVLDVTRDAVMVLGECAAALGDRMQILAFSSKTRNCCWVWEVCGWHEAWQRGGQRLGGLEPRGYTRIGPAIRHATAGLVKVEAERRLLFLLSDGKPTDYDRYEGRYGIADVRRAIQEAHDQRIATHALAIDSDARAHLPAQFGTGNWSVLPQVDMLPPVLAAVYARLTRA